MLVSDKSRPLGVPRTLPASENPKLAEEVMRHIKAPHRPALVVATGEDAGQRLVLERSILIGRDPVADLVLNDALLSWHHARVEDRGDSWTLVDLDSTNGTSVNGRSIKEHSLAPADRIVLGSTAILFELQDGLRQALNENVENLLNIDDLSGLLVRRKFDAELERLAAFATQRAEPLAMLVMDLDGVKKINDTHGHLFGAYVIATAGAVIGRTIGGLGVACRFGGDEYLAALPGLDTPAAAEVAERILKSIAEHVFVKDGVRLHPGISIGVAAIPRDAATPEELFAAADKAMYRAKQAGKNRVVT